MVSFRPVDWALLPSLFFGRFCNTAFVIVKHSCLFLTKSFLTKPSLPEDDREKGRCNVAESSAVDFHVNISEVFCFGSLESLFIWCW